MGKAVETNGATSHRQPSVSMASATFNSTGQPFDSGPSVESSQPPPRSTQPERPSPAQRRPHGEAIDSQELLRFRFQLDRAASLEACCQLYAEYIANTFDALDVVVGFPGHRWTLSAVGAECQHFDNSTAGEYVRFCQSELSQIQPIPADNAPAKSVLAGWPEVKVDNKPPSGDETANADNESESNRRASRGTESSTQSPAALPWQPSKFLQAVLTEAKSAETMDLSAISIPLACDHRPAAGAILMVGARNQCERAAQKIPQLNEVIGPYLSLRRATERSLVSRAADSIKTFLRDQKKLWAIATVLFLIGFIPVPHRIQCDVEVKPDVKRFVSAPFEGILNKTFVDTGDIVDKGTRLARMDEDDLRLQVSSVRAEQERVRKEKGAALAQRETLNMQKARLEYQRLVYKRNLLENREQHLEIVAPISGVILKNELQDAEHAPLSKGQLLFEIAPLEKLRFEIYIAQEDLAYVDIGMTVTVSLDAARRRMRGKISRIHPQSITFENQSVFVAEVEIEEFDSQLKPGMQGYASVESQYSSLGWVLFRRPWGYLQRIAGF